MERGPWEESVPSCPWVRRLSPGSHGDKAFRCLPPVVAHGDVSPLGCQKEAWRGEEKPHRSKKEIIGGFTALFSEIAKLAWKHVYKSREHQKESRIAGSSERHITLMRKPLWETSLCSSHVINATHLHALNDAYCDGFSGSVCLSSSSASWLLAFPPLEPLSIMPASSAQRVRLSRASLNHCKFSRSCKLQEIPSRWIPLLEWLYSPLLPCILWQVSVSKNRMGQMEVWATAWQRATQQIKSLSRIPEATHCNCTSHAKGRLSWTQTEPEGALWPIIRPSAEDNFSPWHAGRTVSATVPAKATAAHIC